MDGRDGDALEKELPKDAKLKRRRNKILAIDESKYWNTVV